MKFGNREKPRFQLCNIVLQCGEDPSSKHKSPDSSSCTTLGYRQKPSQWIGFFDRDLDGLGATRSDREENTLSRLVRWLSIT